MFKIILTAALMLFSQQLISAHYGFYAKHEGSVPITKLVVFSERCCGSNYMQSLLETNFEIASPNFCHKHFPPWYNLPRSEYFGNPQHYNFHDTEDYLFIVIVRNPYDWVRSFHAKPWHATRPLLNTSFQKFIRLPWRINTKDPLIAEEVAFNPLIDRNPIDGSVFKNVFEMRTAKTKNMLLIKKRVKNVYFIRYEAVRDHMDKVLDEIRNLFDLTPKVTKYQPILYYKGMKGRGVYKETKYRKISKRDLLYINSQLDQELERELGYPILTNPKHID